MKRASQDFVCVRKRGFHTVPMMNVQIDVQYFLVSIFKEFEDGQNNVIDVAESGGFVALCVVTAAVPVDDNVG
jgi:hypothetical protein